MPIQLASEELVIQQNIDEFELPYCQVRVTICGWYCTAYGDKLYNNHCQRVLVSEYNDYGESQMNPKFFRVARRIIIFMMICYLGNILWKNHTAPHYVTPSGGVSKSSNSARPAANP